MGLIRGSFEAKAEGFVPGGSSLHNTYASHGNDAETFEKGSTAQLVPQKLPDTLAFMLETRWTVRLTRHALNTEYRQPDYDHAWSGLKRAFEVGDPLTR